ncbi:hypothetical protein [Xanthomonas oryzae]|uniref:hypothetical protein n=1 Tax=Xanthomonas oryzae TaxID=347 RepID=UPI0003766BF3|nr:hypothetical protein [Xanthomonas oryzae]
MKRYKVNKWWQLPLIGPEEGSGSWSVRSIFLMLIPIVVLIGFFYTIFHNLI